MFALTKDSMIGIAASLILFVHAPAIQKASPNGSPPPPPSNYALIPYSPLPTSISASISGAGTVSRTSNFVEDVTVSDSDTFTRSDNGNEVVVGTSKILSFSIDAATGVKGENGNDAPEAFHQFGQTTNPTYSDSSVVAEVIFQNDALAADAYPLYRVVKYHVDDPADPPTKDVPGAVVTKLIQVTSS